MSPAKSTKAKKPPSATKTKAIATTDTKALDKRTVKETREEHAYTLKLRGYKIAGIAAVLGVTDRTVMQYIKSYKDRMGDSIIPSNAKELIGDSILAFDNIEREAWLDWQAADKNFTARARFLDLARAARNDRIKLLKELGIITPPTTTEVIEEYEEIVKDDLNKMPDELKKLVRRAVITRTYTSPHIAEPEPDPTFAKVVKEEDDDEDIIDAQFEKEEE